MKRKFVQISNGYAHWIFEAEELPPYPNPEDFLDITGRNDIKEGYLYDAKTSEFIAPVLHDPAPIEPIEQQESPIQKVERLESIIEQQNLTILDVNLSLFEEILALREEVAQLKETSNV